MKSKLSFLKRNYKIIINSLAFFITLILIVNRTTDKVKAVLEELSFPSKAMIYFKDSRAMSTGLAAHSGQAATASLDGKFVFLFYLQSKSDPSEPGVSEDSGLRTLAIYKKNSSGEYELKKEIQNIKKCGHANSASYYEENGVPYLLVSTSYWPDENPGYNLVKYKMDLTNYEILKTDTISLGKYANGVAWDYDHNRIIVSTLGIKENDSTRALISYKTDFTDAHVIRKVGSIGSPRSGGTIGYYYNTQGIGYFNNKIYAITYVSSSDLCNKISLGMGLGLNCTDPNPKEKLDSYISVYDVNTGDFSKILYVNGETIGHLNYLNHYWSGDDVNKQKMRELEDVFFINNKMYLNFQKAGNMAVYNVTNTNLYEYNKLYVNYKLNGGNLSSTHGNNVSSSGDDILIDGNKKVVNGYTGENLISGGFYNSNDPNNINIEKTGYHLTWEAEWKDANGKEYSQSEEYRVYDLADTSLSDKTITLYANWKANNYRISYDANGGTGANMPLKECVYDKNYTLDKNTFTRQGYKFAGWTLNRDGTGTVYSDQAKVSNLTSYNEGIVVLYAKWTPINYILKLVFNNGTGMFMNFDLTYDQMFYLSTVTPEKTGYTLVGWSTSSSGTSPLYTPNQAVTKLGTSENQVITLYAVWAVGTYTVNFNSTGGSSVPSITRQYGKTLGTLPTPTKIGYTFKGWFTEPSGGTQVNASTVVKGNVTYYAQWTPIKYYLKLVNNDGTATNRNIQLEYGTGYSLSNYQPARSGYTLAGWSTSSTATSPQYSSTQTVTNLTSNPNQTVTLYAVWRVRTYTISFNSSGGSNVASIAREHGKPLGTLPTTTKTGYTLKGWFTEPTNGTQVSASTTVVGNATYYARWTPINYTVSFNANGGTGTMTSVSMKYGNTYTLQANNFERSGYIFNGWNTKPDGTGSNYSNRQQVSNLTTTANATVTLYAKWVVDSGYKITYDLDGGTVSVNNPVNYDSTTPTFKLNNPSKEGYTFKGWTGSNGTTPQLEVNIVQGTTGNLNYKANYEAITYTLTFETGTDAQTLELEYGSEVTQLPSVIRKGYTLLGWYDEEGEFLGETVGVGDKVYNPEFRPNKYTIKYDSNGGEGTMNDQIMEYDQKDAVLNNLFTKSNESFVEWNTKKDSTGQSYKNNDEILNLTDQDNEEIVLYAIWQLSDLPDGGGSHGLEDPKNDQDNTSGNKKNNSVNPKTGATLSIGIIVLLSIIGFILYKFSSKKSLFRKI